jgi:hypothetical protein
MEPVQARALDALEPFLALSKAATSPRAAVELVMRATSAPNTYIFAELLDTPSIQALRQSPDAEVRKYGTLLEIFAWGTWQDYVNCKKEKKRERKKRKEENISRGLKHRRQGHLI